MGIIDTLSNFKYQSKIEEKCLFVTEVCFDIRREKRSWTLAFKNSQWLCYNSSNLNRGNEVCVLEKAELIFAGWICVGQKL